MKKILLLSLVSISHFYFCQSWDTQGNAGTNPATNFLGTKDAQDLVLKTNNVERIRVNASGTTTVGILPASPSTPVLKVNGRAQVVADVNSDAMYIGNHSANVDGGASLLFLRYGAYQPNNPGVLDVSGWPTPNGYEWFFSLKSNGKLFLGTNGYGVCSDCNDYRLFVKNGIRTEKVKVDVASANGWADYVFNKNYKLLSLSDVEKHIDEKGHLPNIPSADDVVKNGINLGEMDAKLLEKIEELTLYVIQLNKDVKQLGEENVELKKAIQSLQK